MPTLSLCMIVKDEEKTLPRLFNSVQGLFDEIVIVDTGSTDRTVQICSEKGCKIFHFTWVDDFSKARNFSFSKARGDYIMWLDADDEILPVDFEKLKALKKALGGWDTYLMNYVYARDEHGKPIVSLFRHRIVKRGIATWKYPIHECMRFPDGTSQFKTDIEVTHRRTMEDAKKDIGRNIRMMAKAVQEDPSDQRLRFYYSKELLTEGRLPESIDSFNIYLKKEFQSLQFHDDRVNAYFYLGMAYQAIGQEDRAIDTWMDGIKLDPRFAEFYNSIGTIHYIHSRWGAAIPWFEIAAKLPVPDVQGMVMKDHYEFIPFDRLCKCYAEVGKGVEAYFANEMALKFRPQEERAKHNQIQLRNSLFKGGKLPVGLQNPWMKNESPTPSTPEVNSDLSLKAERAIREREEYEAKKKKLKLALIWGHHYDDKPYHTHHTFFEATLKDMGVAFDRFSWNDFPKMEAKYDLYFFIDFHTSLYKIPAKFHPRVFYWWDCFHHSFAYPAQVTEHFDRSYFAEYQTVKALRNQGLSTVEWMPPAFYEGLFHPIVVPKAYDMAFVGQPDDTVVRKGHTRKEFVTKLTQKYKIAVEQGFYGDKVNYLYNQSRILFDRTIYNNVGTRLFETIGSGGFVLMNRGKVYNGMDDVGIDGQHFVSYDDSYEDFINKLEYYLKHPEEAQKIAEKGHAHFFAKHRYYHRINSILGDFGLL